MRPTDTCPCGHLHRSFTNTVAIGRDAFAHFSEI